MSDHLDLDVQLVHRSLGIAILSDGQEVPVTNWMDADGDCDAESAVACVCGPCFDGRWYSVDLRDFEEAVVQ